MYQATYDLDTDKITVADGIVVPHYAATIVVDGKELKPTQDKDQTPKILKAKKLALRVDGKNYPIPCFDDLSDEDLKEYLRVALFPM